jgi:hypothetical protein
MIALFIAMLWLVPFNTISLTVNLPFQLKLDRIALPFIVVAWILCIAIGGRSAPRLRLTPIHVAVGTFIAVAFLSVILNVSWLNNQLLFQASLKQLVLVSAYAMFFVVVASVVRRSEVKSFVKYSLFLAIICGIGSLWEYRFHVNLFYQLSGTLFPKGLFYVPQPNAAAVDELGRQLTEGPTEAPLELAAMVALAVAIPLVGLMNADRRRDRYLYGLAACILLAAGFTTFRKSSSIMPAMVVITLACLRPRQVLRLAPVGVLLFGVIHVLAPGAIGGVFDQLLGSQLTSTGSTVHRTDAYDAIRPIVWTWPAFGQGFGSYDANVNRILDSQILMSALETGVIGLTAYLAMILSVLGTARRLLRDSDPQVVTLSLALGASVIAFFASSFLYDTMSFPHGPYIFLTFAALVAVLASSEPEVASATTSVSTASPPPERDPPGHRARPAAVARAPSPSEEIRGDECASLRHLFDSTAEPESRPPEPEQHHGHTTR